MNEINKIMISRFCRAACGFVLCASSFALKDFVHHELILNFSCKHKTYKETLDKTSDAVEILVAAAAAATQRPLS